jgi:hypothetical protein
MASRVSSVPGTPLPDRSSVIILSSLDRQSFGKELPAQSAGNEQYGYPEQLRRQGQPRGASVQPSQVDLERRIADMRERKVRKDPLEAGREKGNREQQAREKLDHEILRPDYSHDRLKLQRKRPDDEIDTGKDKKR